MSAETRALILEEQRRVAIYLGRRDVERPEARRVLMVGPHPDDNLFSTGGTTLKLRAAGVPVHWLCLTDGRACIPGREARAAMAEVRAGEERACAAALGLPPPDLLQVPEDEFTDPARQPVLIQQIREVLDRQQPDAVFVPYFLENHPLHRYGTVLVAKALESWPTSCLVYSWALGSFPPPSVVVDVTAEFPRKVELCDVYRSQMELRDYAGELDILSRQQATYSRAGATFAESFFAQTREEFVRDVLARHLDDPETLAAGVQPMVPPGD